MKGFWKEKCEGFPRQPHNTKFEKYQEYTRLKFD